MGGGDGGADMLTPKTSWADAPIDVPLSWTVQTGFPEAWQTGDPATWERSGAWGLSPLPQPQPSHPELTL